MSRYESLVGDAWQARFGCDLPGWTERTHTTVTRAEAHRLARVWVNDGVLPENDGVLPEVAR
jgi:hypothetical protein